jgi:hypothetical protein
MVTTCESVPAETLLKKQATSIHNSQGTGRAKAGRMLSAGIQNDFEHWALGILHWAFATSIFHQPASGAGGRESQDPCRVV